jgi:hypothetical protein
MALPPKKPAKKQETNLEDVEWEDLSSRTAYLVRPGDEVIMKPLSEPIPVKNNSATVVDAFIYSWKSGNEVIHQNKQLTVMLQKVPSDRLQYAISQFGIGNFLMYLKNNGKKQGSRYYDYTIRIARLNGNEQ